MVKTCPAAMGFAFAAGTTDGPGAFDFTQGDDKVRQNFPVIRQTLNILSNHVILYCVNCALISFLDITPGKCLLEAGEEYTKNPK